MGLVLGIDEAGRGPVIGPMLVAGVLFESAKLDDLKKLGVKDSKLLTREEREGFFIEINKLASNVQYSQFHPQALEENLTQIELNAMAALIKQCRPQAVFLDAPVPPAAIKNFVAALRKRLGSQKLDIVAENKADANYPVVAAASIIAKVHRDRAVEELWAKHGNFGWGYPAEPKTRDFLKACYKRDRKFPDCVRHRWATVQKIAYECDAGVLPL